MTIVSDMLMEINSALGGIPSSYRIGLSQDYDIFEGYIFALLLEEADKVGADVELRDALSTASPTICRFPTSPSFIKSDDPYTYAVISFPGRRKRTLEAHVGKYVSGISKVKHECDVALLYQTEAEACRAYHRSTSRTALPRSSQLLLAIECKYYDSDMKLSLARSFVGLNKDLATENVCFVTNDPRGTPTPGNAPTSLSRLITKHSKGKFGCWQSGIDPNPSNIVNVERLQGLFQEVFNQYLNK